jgi:hypothetical protein
MGHPLPIHDVGRVMASLHPCNIFLHLIRRLSINLIVLMVVPPPMVKIFSSVKRIFFCLFSACYWRRISVIVCHISFKVGVRCPFQHWCALVCRSSLMMHDIDQTGMSSSQDMIFCFQSGFQQIRSHIVLIAASTLKLFRYPE